ncbi:hypothetical protein PGT21_013380 [Puccinia graminis f. sp. tritici]|uniref:Uncharacterized protein n=1 Tax=Puccinia graminis f. sp. tritici TaxID=56615 RepID=A0A5B0QW38_PUCGR|nr:hypothetical protein PGT21_013380 [Puccinia graminis f. sp. tritici]
MPDASSWDPKPPPVPPKSDVSTNLWGSKPSTFQSFQSSTGSTSTLTSFSTPKPPTTSFATPKPPPQHPQHTSYRAECKSQKTSPAYNFKVPSPPTSPTLAAPGDSNMDDLCNAISRLKIIRPVVPIPRKNSGPNSKKVRFADVSLMNAILAEFLGEAAGHQIDPQLFFWPNCTHPFIDCSLDCCRSFIDRRRSAIDCCRSCIDYCNPFTDDINYRCSAALPAPSLTTVALPAPTLTAGPPTPASVQPRPPGGHPNHQFSLALQEEHHNHPYQFNHRQIKFNHCQFIQPYP